MTDLLRIAHPQNCPPYGNSRVGICETHLERSIFFKTYMERSIRPRKPLYCGRAGRKLARPAWASAALVIKVLVSLVSARLEMVSACC